MASGGAERGPRLVPVPESWIPGAGGVFYPPPPWRLGVTLHASLFRVPVRELPRGLPAGVRPVALAGNALAAAGFATYEPGGVLEYRELFAALLVRAGRRVGGTVLAIRVDSPASMAGGRDLWAIPKEMASFRIEAGPPFSAVAEAGGRVIAAMRFEPGRALPLPRRFSGAIVQQAGGRPRHTRAEMLGKPEFGRARWEIAPDGPLGFLSGRRPFLSGRIRHASVSFGV